MAQFSYVAVNKNGEKIKGSLDAPNESEARVMLRSQALRPITISQAGIFEVDLAKLGNFSGGVKDTDIMLFTRQLSILISSGVPLVQGLDIIGGQLKNQNMKRIIMAVKEKITGGTFLWEALAAYKNSFPGFYISMIRAGESSGAMDTMLKRLVKYLEDAYKLKKMVQGAMVYPIAIVGVGGAVVLIMMTYVIPKFEALLKSSNQELPGPTKLVIDVSHFFQGNFFLIVGGIVGGAIAMRQYIKTDDGRKNFDYFMMRVPLFGKIMVNVALARFSRTMQTLLSSGITLLDAIDICRKAVSHKPLEEALLKIRAEIETGKTLSGIMQKIPIFPSMMVQMITVGENTGNMDKMLDRIAEFYEEDVQNTVGSLSKLIEPFILIVLGGLVGGLMIAMYLPIFKMAGGG